MLRLAGSPAADHNNAERIAVELRATSMPAASVNSLEPPADTDGAAADRQAAYIPELKRAAEAAEAEAAGRMREAQLGEHRGEPAAKLVQQATQLDDQTPPAQAENNGLRAADSIELARSEAQNPYSEENQHGQFTELVIERRSGVAAGTEQRPSDLPAPQRNWAQQQPTNLPAAEKEHSSAAAVLLAESVLSPKASTAHAAHPTDSTLREHNDFLDPLPSSPYVSSQAAPRLTPLSMHSLASATTSELEQLLGITPVSGSWLAAIYVVTRHLCAHLHLFSSI